MCYSPILVKHKKGNFKVACGYCDDCRVNKKNNIEFLNQILFKYSPFRFAWFVTFTYNDDNLRISSGGYPNFHLPDIQKFFKAFKLHVKRHYGANLMYTYCIEYTPMNARPHAHCIIYFDKDLGLNWKRFKAIVENYWTYGFTKVGPLESSGGINYLTKYVCKSFAYPESYLNEIATRFKERLAPFFKTSFENGYFHYGVKKELLKLAGITPPCVRMSPKMYRFFPSASIYHKLSQAKEILQNLDKLAGFECNSVFEQNIIPDIMLKSQVFHNFYCKLLNDNSIYKQLSRLPFVEIPVMTRKGTIFYKRFWPNQKYYITLFGEVVNRVRQLYIMQYYNDTQPNNYEKHRKRIKEANMLQ